MEEEQTINCEEGQKLRHGIFEGWNFLPRYDRMAFNPCIKGGILFLEINKILLGGLYSRELQLTNVYFCRKFLIYKVDQTIVNYVKINFI